jgi:4-carboxymuconolactone decarboxylase
MTANQRRRDASGSQVPIVTMSGKDARTSVTLVRRGGCVLGSYAGEIARSQKGRRIMAQSQPSSARDQVRDIVPGLIDLSERVLFGEVWERPGLSKRDRSLITCATLIALGRERQLVGHLQRALDNGLTKNELSEVITHLAFYAGWPAAMTAALVAKDVFDKK